MKPAIWHKLAWAAPAGIEVSRQRFMALLAVAGLAGIAVSLSQGSMMLFALILVAPLAFILLLSVINSPLVMFFAVFVFNYFMIGIMRYVNIDGMSVMMDILLWTQLLLIIMHKVLKAENNWGNAVNLLTILSLVWTLYCVLELVNPSGVTEAWVMSRRLIYQGLMMAVIVSLLFDNFRQVRWVIILYSILTLLAVAKALMQRFAGFDQYEMDWITRYEHGEFFSKDSIKLDENLRYATSLGRPVYGGGGIMPDVFVPQDTTGISSYLIEVSNKGVILQFSFQYTDRNRAKLKEFEDEESLLKYLSRQGIVEQFIRFADSKGIKRRNLLIYKSRKVLERNLYGSIIYNMLGREEYVRYINQSDATVQKALEILKEGKAFPQAPETENMETLGNEGKDIGKLSITNCTMDITGRNNKQIIHAGSVAVNIDEFDLSNNIIYSTGESVNDTRIITMTGGTIKKLDIKNNSFINAAAAISGGSQAMFDLGTCNDITCTKNIILIGYNSYDSAAKSATFFKYSTSVSGVCHDNILYKANAGDPFATLRNSDGTAVNPTDIFGEGSENFTLIENNPFDEGTFNVSDVMFIPNSTYSSYGSTIGR